MTNIPLLIASLRSWDFSITCIKIIPSRVIKIGGKYRIWMGSKSFYSRTTLLQLPLGAVCYFGSMTKIIFSLDFLSAYRRILFLSFYHNILFFIYDSQYLHLQVNFALCGTVSIFKRFCLHYTISSIIPAFFLWNKIWDWLPCVSHVPLFISTLPFPSPGLWFSCFAPYYMMWDFKFMSKFLIVNNFYCVKTFDYLHRIGRKFCDQGN